MKYYLLYRLLKDDINVICLTRSINTLGKYIPLGVYIDDFIKDDACYGIQIDKNTYLKKVVAQ